MNRVVRDLFDRRNRIDQQIGKIRATCKHPNVDMKYGSNTGNWSHTDDSYWIDVKCHDCGHQLRIYDDDIRYTTFDKGRNVNILK